MHQKYSNLYYIDIADKNQRIQRNFCFPEHERFKKNHADCIKYCVVTCLKKVYGDTPVLCISPLWRGDCPGQEAVLERFCDNVKKIAGKYPNVTVVDGFTLVPHLPEYFLDKLHPNCLGMELYGRNLVEFIRKVGF